MARIYHEWNFPAGSTNLPTGAVTGKTYYWLTSSAADACAAIAQFNALADDATAFAQSTSTVPANATNTYQYTYAWQQTSCQTSTPSNGTPSGDVDVVGDNSGYTPPSGSGSETVTVVANDQNWKTTSSSGSSGATGSLGTTNPSGANDPAAYNDYSSETSVRYYQ